MSLIASCVQAADNLGQSLEEKNRDRGVGERLSFSVDTDELAKLATRQIEIIEERFAARSYSSEKRPKFVLDDLCTAMNEVSRHVTLDQATLSELEQEFGKVVKSIRFNVEREEAKRKLLALEHVKI